MSYTSNTPRYNSGYSGNRSFDSNRNERAYTPRQELPVPTEPPKPIDPLSRDLILFKGNYYDVAKLQAQRGPEITVGQHELNDDEVIAAKESRPFPTELINAAPIFAKYEGKYVILLGMQAVLNAVSQQLPIKGKLLSSPTLKNAKL